MSKAEELASFLEANALRSRGNGLYDEDDQLMQSASLLRSQAAEITRLSTELQDALKRCADYAQEAGEWKGRYEAAGYPGTLDGWIARAEKAEAEKVEAVRAERERCAGVAWTELNRILIKYEDAGTIVEDHISAAIRRGEEA